MIEDPATYGYIRPEGGGLMVGLFEAEAAAWNVDGIPKVTCRDVFNVRCVCFFGCLSFR